MPSSTSHESPTLSESLPIDECIHPVTRRASKRTQAESNPLDITDPCTPVPRPKCTKCQAKWANCVRTRSVTESLPPLQETPVSPIAISFEEEPDEPEEDIQSTHSPPSIGEEPPEVFSEECHTPNAEPFTPSYPEPIAQTEEQNIVNEEIQILRGQLAEAEALERHLKAESMQLKDRVAILRDQKKAIKSRGTFYYTKGYKWIREVVKLTKRVKSLKKEIHQLRGRTNSSSQLHLLAEIANRA